MRFRLPRFAWRDIEPIAASRANSVRIVFKRHDQRACYLLRKFARRHYYVFGVSATTISKFKDVFHGSHRLATPRETIPRASGPNLAHNALASARQAAARYSVGQYWPVV